MLVTVNMYFLLHTFKQFKMKNAYEVFCALNEIPIKTSSNPLIKPPRGWSYRHESPYSDAT